MRNRTLALALLAFLLLPFLPTATAAATPKFFETTVVEDTADDYEGQPRESLDLVGVYVSEKYQYDAETMVGQEVITFRFEVASIGAIACTTVNRYDIFFKLDGVDKHFYAGYTTTSPSDRNACAPQPADG